ncbi:hypothetical protein [Pseudoduganella namucuonensis]|nr:hypothetical protein [Pseudoduganella namucuonensis]
MTLTTYWTNELSALAAVLAATQAELNTSRTGARDAGVALATAASKAQAAKEAVNTARRKLSGAAMPADGEALLDAMRAAIAAWRQAVADHAAQAAATQQAEARRDALQLRADTQQAAHDEASQALERETRQTVQRSAWVLAATTPPVGDLPGQAAAALTANEAAATTAVENDFPANADPDKSFLGRARARRLLAQNVAGDAADLAAASVAASTTWSEASTRKKDLVARKQREFDAAVEHLRRFAESAPRTIQAIADLARLATGPSVLTAEERAELITADATLEGDREDALALLTTRDEAQEELQQAQAAYADALAIARIASPDKTDAQLRAADAALQTKFDAMATKASAMVAADTAMGNDADGTPRSILKIWFAAVPDALWEQLDKLDNSLAILGAAKATVPANLVTAVETAEDALAVALSAARIEARQIAAREQGLASLHAAASAAATLSGRREQAAQRYLALA